MCVPAQTHKSSSRTMNPSTHLFSPPYTMTAPGVAVPSGNKFVAETVPHVQLSVHNCLEALGISLLSEWDVLCFLYRRRVSLMSTQQIARLIGYESVVVRSALDRLRREKLVKRSRAVRGGVFTEFWLRQMQAADAALRNSSVCRKVASGDCY
jgi:hypothetical protein